MTSTTLTAAREAERAAHEKAALAADLATAATKHREQVEREEAARPTVTYHHATRAPATFRLSTSGRVIERLYGDGSWCDHWDVDYVLTLASLLPRKPVEVTQRIKNKAWEAFLAEYTKKEFSDQKDGVVAALFAVASDLSAPVAVAAPTLVMPMEPVPEGYVAMGTDGTPSKRLPLNAARMLAAEWNRAHADAGPHDVYALYPVVPDETEGAANG